VGLPTLKDIIDELNKPGRDPRHAFEPFRFSEDVSTMADLKPDMKLPGIVTNVTRFGAFVDVGVHQDGLVHISQLTNGFVKDPTDVVKVSQRVTVKVLEIDIERKRISLSMRDEPAPAKRKGGAPSKDRPRTPKPKPEPSKPRRPAARKPSPQDRSAPANRPAKAKQGAKAAKPAKPKTEERGRNNPFAELSRQLKEKLK